MGKYHGFILGLGLVGFCLFNSNYRSALRSKWFLIGIVIFLVTISPLLVWNIDRDWVSFRFQSQRAVPNSGYGFDRLIITLLVEMLYLFPTFGLPLLWATIRSAIQQISNFNWQRFTSDRIFRDEWDLDKRGLLLWLSLPLILGFTLMSGYQQILPAWKMPGYWTATILLAERIAIERRYSQSRIPARWFFGSAAIIILLMSIAISHIAFGTFQTPGKSAIYGLMQIKNDPSTQLFDIKQLRQGFVNSPRLNIALKNTNFVFTNRYFIGGQIAMAIEPVFHKPLTCFDTDLRGFAFWSKPKQWLGKNAIYIGSKTFDVDLDAKNRYPSYFKKLTKLGEIPIRRGGEIVETFSVYQAQYLLKPFPRPYGN